MSGSAAGAGSPASVGLSVEQMCKIINDCSMSRFDSLLAIKDDPEKLAQVLAYKVVNFEYEYTVLWWLCQSWRGLKLLSDNKQILAVVTVEMLTAVGDLECGSSPLSLLFGRSGLNCSLKLLKESEHLRNLITPELLASELYAFNALCDNPSAVEFFYEHPNWAKAMTDSTFLSKELYCNVERLANTAENVENFFNNPHLVALLNVKLLLAIPAERRNWLRQNSLLGFWITSAITAPYVVSHPRIRELLTPEILNSAIDRIIDPLYPGLMHKAKEYARGVTSGLMAQLKADQRRWKGDGRRCALVCVGLAAADVVVAKGEGVVDVSPEAEVARAEANGCDPC